MAEKKNINLGHVRKASEVEDKFLFDSINSGQERMSKAIRSLERRMINTLKRIETDKSGRIEGAKVNLKQTQAIHRQMLKDFEETYGAEARALVSDFSETDKFIEETWTYLGESAQFTGVDKDMNRAIRNTVNAQYDRFGDEAKQKIDDAMYQHMVGGKDYASLVAAVQGALTGHKDAKGRPMEQYARQFAFDSTMNYHNQVNLRKAEDLDIYHFLYVGDIMSSSRKFCRRRAGKVYTRGQINSWDRYNWAGKSGPAFTNRGGYNCRHHWRPVRPEWLGDKTQVDIADWRVGPSAIQAKPKKLKKTKGARGWNDYTKEERTVISRIHKNVKKGSKFTEKQRDTRFWFNSLNQEERDNLIKAFEDEGFEVPELLRKGSDRTVVKPIIKPKPVIKPKPSPKPITPKPGPVPPPPITGGRSWKEFTSTEKSKFRSLRNKIIKGHQVKPNLPRVKWFLNELSAADRAVIIKRWEDEGLVVPDILRGDLPIPKPSPGKKITPVKPKPDKDKAIAKGDVGALRSELAFLDAKIATEKSFGKKNKLIDRRHDVRAEFAKVCTRDEYTTLRKRVIDHEIIDEGTFVSPLDDYSRQTFHQGLRHIGFSMLNELNASNMRLNWGVYGRASFGFGRVNLYKSGMGVRVVAHEVGHGIDSYMSDKGRRFSISLGNWDDKSKFVRKGEGKKYRKWYKDQCTGMKGSYSNGDGAYDIGNFINDYEGRIYNNFDPTTKKKSIAEEFFSVGSERYAQGMDKCVKDVKYWMREQDLMEQYRHLKEEIKREQRSWERERLEHQLEGLVDIANMSVGKTSGEDYLEKFLKTNKRHPFKDQLEMYPDYADWMMKFYKRTREDRPLEFLDFTENKWINTKQWDDLAKIAELEE